jgi:putative transposase
MARHPRLIVPDVAVHVRQRGNNRQNCFREDSDRLVYLSNLAHFCRRWRCALHAYCLMTNHVHLLLTPANGEACALLMRDLGRCYVPYFNRRYGRTGSLWEGRFGSSLVDSARYLLGCYRYIERNPVRAGMVSSPGAYRWSSYAGNSGARADTLLTHHAEYHALAIDEANRYRAYAAFLRQEEDEDFLSAIRDATNGGYPLVGEELKARLVMTGSRIERGRPGPRIEPQREEEMLTGQLPL